jgi:hypothetical protein
MRIAVLIYGRINKAVEHYANIVESIGSEHKIEFFLSSDNAPPDQLVNFIDCYKPMRYINDKIEHNINLKGYPTQPEVNLSNMLSHFINKKRVYELLEKHVLYNNTKYDVIISLRVDVFFTSCFDYSTIEDNTIKIPNCYDYGSPGINDQIGYGKEEEMMRYMKLIDKVEELVKTKGAVVHPETLTLRNLEESGVRIERVSLEYSLRK